MLMLKLKNNLDALFLYQTYRSSFCIFKIHSSLKVGKIMENVDIERISSILGYTFKNENIIKTAFTHSSYANVHSMQSNERLEFLGDSVLNFCTTQFLFNNFSFNEGELSKTRAYLVSSEYVSKFIQKKGLIQFLQCHNFNPKQSTNVMGDLFEAIVGAMFLDAGIEVCEKFIYNSLKYSKALVEEVHLKTKDYKTELQELVQAKEDIKPEYVLIEKTGPAHMPMFTVQVTINGKNYAIATAKSKKEAENLCAKNALKMLKD